MELTFVTGNSNKASQVAQILTTPVKTSALEVHEIQSLNLEEVLKAKALEAYKQLGVPLIVDDVSLVIDELYGLPGPLIKWFLAATGPEGVCRMADLTKTRAATATVGIGYCDNTGFAAFYGTKKGVIAQSPRGAGGFGWDSTFIQEGFELTRAELSDQEYAHASIRKIALDALKLHLGA